MKKSTLLIPVLAILISGIIGFGAAAEARDGYRQGYGGGYPCDIQSMTQEQQDAARKIYQDFTDIANPLRRQMQSKRAELQAQLHSLTPDNKKIEDISKEMGELRGKMLVARSDMRGKMEKAGLPAFGPGFGFDRHRGDGRGFGKHMRGGMGGYGPCGW